MGRKGPGRENVPTSSISQNPCIDRWYGSVKLVTATRGHWEVGTRISVSFFLQGRPLDQAGIWRHAVAPRTTGTPYYWYPYGNQAIKGGDGLGTWDHGGWQTMLQFTLPYTLQNNRRELLTDMNSLVLTAQGARPAPSQHNSLHAMESVSPLARQPTTRHRANSSGARFDLPYLILDIHSIQEL